MRKKHRYKNKSQSKNLVQSNENKESQLADKLLALNMKEEELQVQKMMLLEKAVKSNNPRDLLTANSVMLAQQKNKIGKSFLIDPYNLNENLGYKDKPLQVSYGILRGMAKTPIIKSIVGTRIEQVANYSQAQDDIQKVGWTIRKKKRLYVGNLITDELTDQDRYEIEGIIKFVENCGVKEKKYHGNNFESFLRMFTKDSLELDQGAFEVIPNRILKPTEFYATDGATYRLASSYMNHQINEEDLEVNGYYPYFVQIFQGLVQEEFYPWELCFGTRNLSTSIYNYGYGCSELEDMIKIVTWMLYADSYNGKFFSQGSNPKGILQIQGQVDEDKLAEFRTQWRQQVAGVENAWRVPVLQGDTVNWIDMQKSNADMEFSQWQQYLIKLACALYKIAPEEIGFMLDGGSGSTNYNGSQEYKFEYSKDKGLMPLLRFIAKKINMMVIDPLTNGKYEFAWTGIVDETEDSSLDNDIKKLSNGILTWKEIRAKYGKPGKLEADDFLLNQIWLQMRQQQQQAQMGNPFSNLAVDGMNGNGGSNPFEGMGGAVGGLNGEFMDVEDVNDGENGETADDNPFMKDLLDFMDKTIIRSK